MANPSKDGLDILIKHLRRCRRVDAVITTQRGTADVEVAALLAAGWTLDGTEHIGMGKRVRYLRPPAREGAGE